MLKAVLLLSFVLSANAQTTKEVTSGDVSAAGDAAVANADKLIDGNRQRDGSLSGQAAASSTVSINPNALSAASNYTRQADDVAATYAAVKAELDQCTKFGEAALAAAKAKAEALRAAADACASSSSSSSDGKSESKDCSSEEAKADAAEKEVAAIEKALQEKCKDPLNSRLEKLSGAQKQARNAARQAQPTSIASSSGGGGGKDKKDKDKDKKKEEPEPGTVTVDCTKPDGPSNSACDSYFLKTCASQFEDSNCHAFADRYCGLADTSDDPRPNAGEPYCKKAQAYYFCNPKGPNDLCLTCKNLQSTMDGFDVSHSTDDLVTNYHRCPSDPMFLDKPTLNHVLNAIGTPSTSYTPQGR